MAICEVDGGPEYEISLAGEANSISYTLDKTALDFGEQLFFQVIFISFWSQRFFKFFICSKKKKRNINYFLFTNKKKYCESKNKKNKNKNKFQKKLYNVQKLKTEIWKH